MKNESFSREELKLAIKLVEDTLEYVQVCMDESGCVPYTCILLGLGENSEINAKTIKFYHSIMDIDTTSFYAMFYKLFHFYCNQKDMGEIRLTALCFLHTMLTNKLHKKSCGF